MSEKYYIVRTEKAGVFFGKILKKENTPAGNEVTMTEARRLWRWRGAATLSQLSIDGVSNPGGCKFPAPVDEIVVTNAKEIITCTDKAVESIKSVPVWKA